MKYTVLLTFYTSKILQKKKNGELFTAPVVFFHTCLPSHLFIATEYTNNRSWKSTSCTRKMHTALCLINWGFYLPSGYTNLCLNEDYISFTVLTQPLLFLHLSLQCIFCHACAQQLQYFSSILVLSPRMPNGSHLPMGTGFTWWKQGEAEAQTQQWWACLQPSALLHCNSDCSHKGIHLHWQSPSALLRQVGTQKKPENWNLTFYFKIPFYL